MVGESVHNNYDSYVVIENTHLRYPNFAGNASTYNPAGKRTFCVDIPEDMVDKLVADGWNIRQTNPRDPDETPVYFTQCVANFDRIPTPNVWRVSSESKVRLTESNVGILDYDDIEYCDVVLQPYHWEFNGKSGTKGYLKSLYAVVMEDPFSAKYNDISTVGENTEDGVAE